MRNEKRNRLQSDIRDPTFKICVPGRIITGSTDIQDLTLKKRNQETTKVVSTISACTLVWLAPKLFKYSSKILYSLHYSFHPILFHFHLISYLNMSCFLSAFTNQTNGDQFLVLKYQFNVKFISASAPSKAGHHSQVV